ncbi:ATP-binding protein [Rhodococcus aetherivorans]|uniref:ATP-binding protein n=1 Tax=Rhodococcus aetherivorans TaxID=191292 RepID=UPI00369CACE2
MTTGAGLRYLLGRTELLEERIRTLVAQRRMVDPAPDDPFRGLYIGEDVVERILEGTSPPIWPPSPRRDQLEREADRDETTGCRIRLRDLARSVPLAVEDVELLLVCLLPDLDTRFERLYGYLNDDVTRRRATVGLALTLVGLSPLVSSARARLLPGSPLIRHALVLVEETERPYLTRGLRVPDRVTAHLLGDDGPDSLVVDLLIEVPRYESAQVHELGECLRRGLRFVYLRERLGRTGAELARAALAAAGTGCVCVDADRMAEHPDPSDIVPLLGREALLAGAGLILVGVDALSAHPAVFRRAAALPVPVFMVGTGTWDPNWADVLPLAVEVEPLTTSQRAALWSRAAGTDVDVDAVSSQFILGPRQVERAVQSARANAIFTDTSLTTSLLRGGARAQNTSGLERAARRIEPAVGWPDIVLPDHALRQLHELSARARHRHRVLAEWKMRPGGGRGLGVTALFAGDSGTGKTMAAEVVASVLGLDLYTVDLAAVVSKYIGETEKNLERIFSEADGVNAVLLFDEADAIFGKRSEVRDAHDRYANIESAFLLQRMETFDGLAILATNLRANLDDAFTRRLDIIVDFPEPDVLARRRLWERCLRPPLPCGDDLDLQYCAEAFVLTGGNIRSASISAAYAAADAGRPVSMIDVIAAVQQEYRKLGRLVPGRGFAGRPEDTSQEGRPRVDHSPI